VCVRVCVHVCVRVTIKRDNNINASLPLPTGYHQISNVVWDFSVLTV